MFGTEDHRIAAVEPERDSTTRAVALFRHFDGPKSCCLNVDLESFDRCDEHVPPVALAWVHAALGDVDQAFACLQRAYDMRDPLLRLVKVEPLLDPLHADPRWRALLRRMSLE
jgi:hypothetical protein